MVKRSLNILVAHFSFVLSNCLNFIKAMIFLPFKNIFAKSSPMDRRNYGPYKNFTPEENFTLERCVVSLPTRSRVVAKIPIKRLLKKQFRFEKFILHLTTYSFFEWNKVFFKIQKRIVFLQLQRRMSAQFFITVHWKFTFGQSLSSPK